MTDDQRPASPLERAVAEFLSVEHPTVTLGHRSPITYAVVRVTEIESLRAAVDPERPAPRPFVAFDPAVRSGRPTIGGTGLLVEQMAGHIWGGWTEAEIRRDWDYLTRGDLLTACWWQGMHGGRTWRKRWKVWAESVHGDLWRTSADDYASVAWPPTKDDAS